VNKFWSSRLDGLEPYEPGEQPKGCQLIKLNTNENPYPPSPKVLEAIQEAPFPSLRLYPDPDCTELCAAIAEFYGLTTEQIFVGNGSDEVLAFCFPAFFDSQKPILFADITYSFYPVYAKMFQVDYRTVPLKSDFTMPVEAFGGENGGVIIANPNAPTGAALARNEIERILQTNRDRVVIVDEAYVDFGAESAVQLIDRYENLLVVQTFSKSRSLAGMRIGFALGNKNLIGALNCVKNSINSYTLDRLAIAAGTAAIKDRAYFEETCRKIITTRQRTTAELRGLGFDVIESKTNFVFAAHSCVPAEELFSNLRTHGILVRYFNKPRIDDRLRISIGTDEDMDALITALHTILS
jgi:histidinol-phosphate aminotransferase